MEIPRSGNPEIAQFVESDITRSTFDEVLKRIQVLTGNGSGFPLMFDKSPFREEVLQYRKVGQSSGNHISSQQVIGRAWEKVSEDENGSESLKVALLDNLGRGIATGARRAQSPGQVTAFAAFSQELDSVSFSGILWLYDAQKVGDIQVEG
jgi:hypothetical protein